MSGPLQVDIPQPGDLISNSQVDLLQNSQYWAASLGKDHQIIDGDTSGTTFEGRHLQVSLLDQVDDDLPFVADGSDSQIWSSNGALWWRNSTSAAQKLMDGSNKLFLPIRASVIFANNTGAMTNPLNVASVTQIATGIYEIVMTNPVPTANYYILTTCRASGASAGSALEDSSFASTTTTFRLRLFNSTSSLSNTNPQSVTVIVFGG